MHLQGILTKLLEIKDRLGAVPENQLTGTEVRELLDELQQTLSVLDAEEGIDKSRLANVRTFVETHQALDTIVRRVLLGLITKFAKNPTVETKPVGDLANLMSRIPGLEEILQEQAPITQGENAKGSTTGREIGLDKQSETSNEVQDSNIGQTQPETSQPLSTVDSSNTLDRTGRQEAAVTAESNSSFNLKELLGVFLQEATEQIEKLSSGVLELEKEGANFELVNELFRNAHTLKGASGTMGYTSIVRITHLSEDILDNLRQEKCSVSPKLIDLLLDVTDRVRSIVNDIQEGGDGTGNVDDLVVQLESFLGRTKPTEPEPLEHAQKEDNQIGNSTAENMEFELGEPEWALIKKCRQAAQSFYKITVNFNSDVLMPSVRAVMITRKLEGYGQIITVLPSFEEIRKDNCRRFKLLLASSEELKGIEKEILQISEVENVTAEAFKLPAEIPVEVITNVQTIKPEPQSVEKGSPAPEPTPRFEPKTSKNQTIRVPANRLDDLLNLVGEMVISRTRLVSLGTDLKTAQPQEHNVNMLNETILYLGRLMNELQESVMAMRMVPIGQVFSRFPRLIRDLSRKTGKEVELTIRGEETELDKTIIEEIGDPLMHLVRNAVDHGIENPAARKAKGKPVKGSVTLEAFHDGSHIVVEITDDGNGIDLNRVKEKALANGLIEPGTELDDRELANLIFLPGLSTAPKITDISGRGVGMDVVKKSLNNLGGLIDIKTAPGQGTTFSIRLPLTLAIIQALMVEVSGENYAIPLASVLETIRVPFENLKSVGGHPVIQLRGNTLPIISLQKDFGLRTGLSDDGIVYVVVVGYGERRLGLMVDNLKGQQEIVIKPLGDLLGNVPGFSGATIGGDGKVTLILDVGSLVNDKLAAVGSRGSK